jgi:hypothetical protein
MRKFLAEIPHPEILLPGVILILIHLGIFVSNSWFERDTIFIYYQFYGMYANWFFHREIANWLPYGCYGLPGDYLQISFFSAGQYLAGLAGWLLRIRDVTFLFKLSGLLEQTLLWIGSSLLAGMLFKKRSTIFFVCLGLIANGFWPLQINWNSRIYYLLPLLFYLLLVFLKRKRPHYFWLAGASFLMAQIGAPVYFVIYQFVASALFFAGAVFIYPFHPKCLFRVSRRNLLALGLFLFVAAAYLYFSAHYFDHIATDTPGRDTANLTVPLESFLKGSTGSCDISTEKFIGFFCPRYIGQDTTLYLGILPLIFCLYGMLTVKRPLFAALGWSALGMLLLSLAINTIMAHVLYWIFPPFRFCRNLGNLSVCLRFYIPFLAGFGFERYFTQTRLTADQRVKFHSRRLFAFCSLIILALLALAKYYVFKRHHPYYEQFPGAILFVFSTAALCVILLVIQRIRTRLRIFLALIFFGVDILGYQIAVQYSWIFRIPPTVDMTPAGQLEPFVFQGKRTEAADLTPRMAVAREALKASLYGASPESFIYLLLDPSTQWGMANFHWSRGVFELLKLRYPFYLSNRTMKAVEADARASEFLNLFGIAVPKICLVSNVFFADDHEQAKSIIATTPRLDTFLVLEGVPPGTRDRWNRFPEKKPSEGAIRIEYFSFNRLRLNVDVINPEGTWLYYADAYHPGWHARINGKKTPIARAYAAFKAVYLEQGKNDVEFYYFDGFQSLLSRVIPVLGILFFSAVVILFYREFFSKPCVQKDSDRPCLKNSNSL